MARHHLRRWSLAGATMAVAALATGCFGDGLHPVGGNDGVASGVYRTAGARTGEVCTYSRHGAGGVEFGAGFSGEGHGPQYLEVMFTDRAVATSGCEPWVELALVEPALTPGDPIPQGTYRVGTEVRPGTYSTAGNAVCEWSLLRNARHEDGSVISDGTVRGLVGFVTIRPTDTYFATRGCDAWRPVV